MDAIVFPTIVFRQRRQPVGNLAAARQNIFLWWPAKLGVDLSVCVYVTTTVETQNYSIS